MAVLPASLADTGGVHLSQAWREIHAGRVQQCMRAACEGYISAHAVWDFLFTVRAVEQCTLASRAAHTSIVSRSLDDSALPSSLFNTQLCTRQHSRCFWEIYFQVLTPGELPLFRGEPYRLTAPRAVEQGKVTGTPVTIPVKLRYSKKSRY